MKREGRGPHMRKFSRPIATIVKPLSETPQTDKSLEVSRRETITSKETLTEAARNHSETTTKERTWTMACEDKKIQLYKC